MAVPDFQAVMLPLLELTSDGQEHVLGDAIDELARNFKLTLQEREELLPSGRQARFDNRVGWARTHLAKAGLVEGVGRGKFRLTDRGAAVLRQSPDRVDVRFLMQYPEYRDFKSRSYPSEPMESGLEESGQTPKEALELSYQSLRSQLAQDLLQQVKTASPKFFERLVVDLLLAMGYGGSLDDAGQAVGRSGDGGIDGIIKEDKLGLDVLYIQAKRWERTVDSPDVMAFAGSLQGQRAGKGVMITTSQFSREARESVSKIVLIDGEQLAQLMIEHGVGVADVQTYTVKRVDLDYFSEEP